MSDETAPVSIVIPVLDEEATLPALLHALEAQTVRPEELVIVNAGSRDASLRMIGDWWERRPWPGSRLYLLEAPGAFPGSARNAGIEKSMQPWIAFLDAGVTPASEWLQALMKEALRSNPPAVFGVTRFMGRSALTVAICAVSYGEGAARATLPGSAFQREVFEELGGFDARLRAGEDTLWLKMFHSAHPGSPVELRARGIYSHFPASLGAAAKKWFLYEEHVARAGLNRHAILAYLAMIAAIGGGFVVSVPVGVACLLTYVLLRGVLDPIRRSARWDWWRGHPASFLLAPLCAVVIDAAKMAGRVKGILMGAHA